MNVPFEEDDLDEMLTVGELREALAEYEGSDEDPVFCVTGNLMVGDVSALLISSTGITLVPAFYQAVMENEGTFQDFMDVAMGEGFDEEAPDLDNLDGDEDESAVEVPEPR